MSRPSSARRLDSLFEYSTRDYIEKSFKSGKSYADIDTLCAHGDETAEGRLIIGFCCMTILSHIHALMNKTVVAEGVRGKAKEIPPLSKDMTFNELKNYLSSARLLFDGHCNARWCELTNKQHLIAKRLGYPNLYKDLPEWGVK